MNRHKGDHHQVTVERLAISGDFSRRLDGSGGGRMVAVRDGIWKCADRQSEYERTISQSAEERVPIHG